MDEPSGVARPAAMPSCSTTIRSVIPARSRCSVPARGGRPPPGRAAHGRPDAADALVAGAFAGTEDIVRGGGPSDAFRPHLLAGIGRSHPETGLGSSSPGPGRTRPGPADPEAACAGPTPVATAFLALPERWQAVLWHADVDRTRPGRSACWSACPRRGARPGRPGPRRLGSEYASSSPPRARPARLAWPPARPGQSADEAGKPLPRRPPTRSAKLVPGHGPARPTPAAGASQAGAGSRAGPADRGRAAHGWAMSPGEALADLATARPGHSHESLARPVPCAALATRVRIARAGLVARSPGWSRSPARPARLVL